MIKQIAAGGVGSNEPKEPGMGTGRWRNIKSPLTGVEDLAKELKRYTDYLNGITGSKPSFRKMYIMHRIAQIGHIIKDLKRKKAKGNNV